MKIISKYFLYTLSCLLALSVPTYSLASIAERQQAHMQVALNSGLDSINVMPIQAYQGMSIDDTALDAAIAQVLASDNPDFHLTKLIRVLFYTDAHDDKILDLMGQYNMWLTSGEDRYTYWSENHMIMWMSTDWLLHESYSWNSDADLRQRLVRYLELKIDYGFYEFNSSTYFPYTLSGLLNLADFAVDSEIKSLATQAALKLLNSVSELVSDEGIFLPAAGRNYVGKYRISRNHNHNRVIYVIFGLGDTPSSASAISSFITTTGVDFSAVENGWSAVVNKVESIGHSIATGKSINSDLSRLDRVIFQWSHGCYLHPDCAADTSWAIDTYDLGDHSAFETLATYIPTWGAAASGAASIGATFSRSSNLSQADINKFKQGGSTLSSIDDYYGGYFGYQQYPLVATTGNIATFIQSGQPEYWINKEDDYLANTHLPRVDQDAGLAMAMFWPNAEISIGETVAGLSTDVALFWPSSRFEQTATVGNWLVGARSGSYVAVLRPCTGKINNIHACSGDSGRQMWAMYVSTEDEVGSFTDFVEIIQSASYRTSYTYNFWLARFEYYARVTVNGQELKRTWTDPLL